MSLEERPRSGPVVVIVVGVRQATRARLTRSLESHAEFSVIADLEPGQAALDACRARRPALVVLDAEPLATAADFADELTSFAPVPILALVASSREADARGPLIAAGVVEVAPLDDGEIGAEVARVARLVARIRVVTRRRTRRALPPETTASSGLLPRSASVLRGVVAIGASTGGPAAVAEILKGLVAPFPLPVLVVIHIGPSFGASLAEWLAASSRVPVHEASDGTQLVSGHVYVCPPERHLVLEGDRLRLTRDPERHSCRPSVDVLFESVARESGERAIGCLLTGIGRDGAAGLLTMHERGALTIAQDEASSVVFGMPREAIALGAADIVAPASQIASILSTNARILAATSVRPAVPSASSR